MPALLIIALLGSDMPLIRFSRHRRNIGLTFMMLLMLRLHRDPYRVVICREPWG